MTAPRAKTQTLRELVLELSAVELPTDGKAGPADIDEAFDDLDERALWRHARKLWALVAKARRLVGQPDRENHGPLRM